jgi:FkbM family methyltransferase
VRQDRVNGLVEEFRGLGEVDRRSFLRATIDSIPSDSFVDLQAAAKPRRLDYPRADIYLRVTTKGETLRLSACAKEPFTIEWIENRIGAGEVFYDIGANVGAYSLVAAMKPGGGASVFSFEPSYASVASLCANIVLNDVAGRVTPIPIALAGDTAMNVFSLRDLEPGAARHVLGDGVPDDGPSLYRQPVMTFRLDDVVESFHLPVPNHIKLDVDGGELDVIQGASRTLASPALRSMLIEVSSALSAPVTEALERHGLRLESKFDVTSKACASAVWYGLFARCAEGARTGTR